MKQQSGTTAESAEDGTVRDVTSRLIDHWFPCAAVDAAVGTPAGSGRSEKALFTWFASRPIAQARAAVLSTLLPDDDALHDDVVAAVQHGDREALTRLRKVISNEYPEARPVVLDVFSGRGIIPLEAARLGVTSVGTDLSPVATLASRVLADYPFRDWSAEPVLPFGEAPAGDDLFGQTENRLLSDVRSVMSDVEARVVDAVKDSYPRDGAGRFPWAYLWAVTIPCDQCKRTFPLVANMTLRHPYRRTDDPGQAFRLVKEDDSWHVEVFEGVADQAPTFAAAPGKRGKSARCLFCGHVHALDTVKAKGFSGQYGDVLLVVADGGDTPRKTFRAPRVDELAAATNSAPPAGRMADGPLTVVPDEAIPEGNNHTIRGSAYGYRTYGELLGPRQRTLMAATVAAVRAMRQDLLKARLSTEYANALTAYAAANIVRSLKHSTRGSKLRSHGNAQGTAQNRVQVDHIFSDESKVAFGLDYLEVGPGSGPGTWGSLAETGHNALRKILEETSTDTPGRFRRASAVALPFRDSTVDAVITDPPYYNMIDYADASDLFHVWLKRCLFDVFPELFDTDGLQDKSEEIIVKNGNAPGEHRTRDYYEHMLSRAFLEAKRVLRADGHLVVVFGHSDPDAWLRLLSALHEAGFVVTSAWPSRTESSNTGVASIKVTVTIGCRVAPSNRPAATAARVDREVSEAVKAACRDWDRDGLALTDQLMAAYGPAMAVYGRYGEVLKPDGTSAEITRYLTLARAAVRDATALRLDELPLETFDAATRFAVFWQRLYGRGDVPKGEARFLAQADNLRLEELRGPLLTESKAGFKLRLDQPDHVTEKSATFEVARAMAAAWDEGGTEAVASVIAAADRAPNDAHLWAVVAEIGRQLPDSDKVAKALAAVVRNSGTIGNLVPRMAEAAAAKDGQLALPMTEETPR